MLIDGQIRNRLVSLADTVAEGGVDEAFQAVIEGATARRKREVGTRMAIVASALAVVAAGFTAGWNRHVTEQVEEPVPATETIPDEARPEQLPSDPHPAEESRGDRTEALSGDRSPRRLKPSRRDLGAARAVAVPPKSKRTAISGTVEKVPQREAEDQAEGSPDPEVQAGGTSAEAKPSYEVTHREAARYGRSYVSFNPDRRSGCSLDAQSCRWFPSRPEDAFAVVTVDDGAGTVFVRVTQWDRYGRTVGEALTYCGGESEVFSLAEGITQVSVSVEKGVCHGIETTPSGGRAEVAFLRTK